ncbi:MAG TPA: hypothetical protein PK239_07425 [Chitinophagales bacterium]|nr:hypothetical protein [Chitinophagales bacterium]HRK27105.1 hypothetical protein [Chitinophagales bacterium]
MWSDAIQMFFLLLVTSVLTYLVFCWRKTTKMAKEIDDLNARLQDLLAQNAILNDRNAKFEANILQLKTDLANAAQQKANLHAELRTAQNQNADRLLRIQTLEGFEAQLINLNSQFVNLETQHGQITLQLQQALNEKETLSSQLAERHAAFLALEERYNALLNSSNQLRAEVDTLQLQIAGANTQDEPLQLQINTLTAQLDDVTFGSNALLQSIERQQQDIDNLKQETDTLNAQLDQRESLIASLQAQLAAKEANEQATSGNNNPTDPDDLNALIEALSMQVGNLEMVRSGLTNTLNTAQTQLADKDDFITLLQGKIASLSVHLADQETINSQLHIELDDCRKKYNATAQELSDEEKKLAEIRAKMSLINFERIGFASEADKDNLQLIKGIGPFIERKLNALGIFTFRQIANFTPEDVERVTDAIEFFPGRIVRDNWVTQADEFARSKGK